MMQILTQNLFRHLPFVIIWISKFILIYFADIKFSEYANSTLLIRILKFKREYCKFFKKVSHKTTG